MYSLCNCFQRGNKYEYSVEGHQKLNQSKSASRCSRVKLDWRANKSLSMGEDVQSNLYFRSVQSTLGSKEVGMET